MALSIKRLGQHDVWYLCCPHCQAPVTFKPAVRIIMGDDCNLLRLKEKGICICECNRCSFNVRMATAAVVVGHLDLDDETGNG